MKTMKFFLMMFLSVLVLTLNSCKEDDPKTGDLIVFAEDLLGDPITGEYVYLYTSQANFNSQTYSQRIVTDNTGRVEFSELDPQTYWVDCVYTNALGFDVTCEGTGTVDAGLETTITIFP